MRQASFYFSKRNAEDTKSALIFDGNIALRKLRSCLAWDALALRGDVNVSAFLRELNLDRGNGSLLASLAQHFGFDFDFKFPKAGNG
jgi:hypothetical protein